MLFTAVFSALVLVFARPIAGAFFDEPELLGMGVTTLRVLALSVPFAALGITFDLSCSGAGETRAPMFFGMLHTWLLQLPLILLATRVLHWGYQSVWWAILVSGMLGPACFWFYFRRRTWLGRKV